MPKVLLLEDDRDMMMLLRTLLELEGYAVAPYEAAVPALQLAERAHPDVILLDVHLGGQDGIKILKDLRARPDLAHLRVVMTSGINLSEECLSQGADAFITKPYMPDTLLSLLKSVMATPAGERYSPPPAENSGASSAKLAKFL